MERRLSISQAEPATPATMSTSPRLRTTIGLGGTSSGVGGSSRPTSPCTSSRKGLAHRTPSAELAQADPCPPGAAASADRVTGEGRMIASGAGLCARTGRRQGRFLRPLTAETTLSQRSAQHGGESCARSRRTHCIRRCPSGYGNSAQRSAFRSRTVGSLSSTTCQSRSLGSSKGANWSESVTATACPPSSTLLKGRCGGSFQACPGRFGCSIPACPRSSALSAASIRRWATSRICRRTAR